MNRRTIQTRTLQMQLCEAGQGPLVVLCHGFPELGSTWRHQLRALAAAGYHAVAPDQRGYGLTESPVEVERYTMLHLVGDVVALIDALGEERAVLVGHDWGAPVVWNTALLRPDRVRGVVGISVPPARRSPVRPTEALRATLGEDYYQLQFQVPGAADTELARDVRTAFLRMLYGASGDVAAERRWRPAAGGFLSGMVLPEDGAVPRWIEATHVDELVATFARTGFTGGLSWYRNLDRNWELLAPFEGLNRRAVITSPARSKVTTAAATTPIGLPLRAAANTSSNAEAPRPIHCRPTATRVFANRANSSAKPCAIAARPCSAGPAITESSAPGAKRAAAARASRAAIADANASMKGRRSIRRSIAWASMRA